MYRTGASIAMNWSASARQLPYICRNVQLVVGRVTFVTECRAAFQRRPMNFLFYIDPATGAPHLWRHNVREEEAEDVLRRPIEDRPGREGARIAIGQTRAGRYLRVIYVADPEPESVFCITAYELGPKALHALRRRRRKKQ